ncbi:DUF6456 domain-containing protein [Rhizobium sp. R693]|uniref:DUF6456 domain-containing protein n=1 Tax=Rhizobium sp. R693 TaxID=1764276 RepID=UPI002478027E|nr:DUF6456 domain-containing protein [Rhizobium sp. R693]
MEALAAGDRLLADFTRSQSKPRITASWEPRHASRMNGARGGRADLTDSAIAARVGGQSRAGSNGTGARRRGA